MTLEGEENPWSGLKWLLERRKTREDDSKVKKFLAVAWNGCWNVEKHVKMTLEALKLLRLPHKMRVTFAPKPGSHSPLKQLRPTWFRGKCDPNWFRGKCDPRAIPHQPPFFPPWHLQVLGHKLQIQRVQFRCQPATVGFPLSASPAKRKAAGEFWMATVARVGLDLGQIWEIFYTIGKLMDFLILMMWMCFWSFSASFSGNSMDFCRFFWDSMDLHWSVSRGSEDSPNLIHIIHTMWGPQDS